MAIHHGSVVTCMTCKQEITGSITGWAEFAVYAVLLGKAFTHMHAVNRNKSGCLVGPRRLVCVISYVHQNLWLPGCMFPTEMAYP